MIRRRVESVCVPFRPVGNAGEPARNIPVVAARGPGEDGGGYVNQEQHAMQRSLLAYVLLTTLILPTAPFAAEKREDVKEIQQVMESFHRAVVTHDGAKLSTLFVPEGSAWFNVLSRAKSPDAPKIRPGSYQAFASFVSSSKAALDPQHSHVKILTDGVIAVVYFDFVFLIDGKPENRGAETWQLVKGPEGWLIAAITYSSEPQEP